MRNDIAFEAMVRQGRAEWREEFHRLAGVRRLWRPILVFLPTWWRDPNAAFAYFNVVAIGPGLACAPSYVRNYVLAHEIGHIARGHTLGQVVFWIAAIAAIVMGSNLPGLHAAQLVSLVIAVGSAWILVGETRREFQADDMVSALYGDETLCDGLRWMESHRHRPPTKLYRRRLARALVRERKAS